MEATAGTCSLLGHRGRQGQASLTERLVVGICGLDKPRKLLPGGQCLGPPDQVTHSPDRAISAFPWPWGQVHIPTASRSWDPSLSPFPPTGLHLRAFAPAFLSSQVAC